MPFPDLSKERVRLEKVKNKLECLRQLRHIHEKSVKRQIKRLNNIKCKIDCLGKYRNRPVRRPNRSEFSPNAYSRGNSRSSDRRRNKKMLKELLESKKRRPCRGNCRKKEHHNMFF